MNAGEDDTSDDLVLQVPETIARITKEYNESGKGPLATNFIDAAMKLRPTDEEVGTMGPEFIKFWEETLADRPDKPLILTFLATIRPVGYILLLCKWK